MKLLRELKDMGMEDAMSGTEKMGMGGVMPGIEDMGMEGAMSGIEEMNNYVFLTSLF